MQVAADPGQKETGIWSDGGHQTMGRDLLPAQDIRETGLNKWAVLKINDWSLNNPKKVTDQ